MVGMDGGTGGQNVSCRGPGAAKLQHLKHEKQTRGWQGSILRVKGGIKGCSAED